MAPDATPPDEHKFNDDLLLAREDLDLAARKYPEILHVLDHPELRREFAIYDVPANMAKRNGRRLGMWAIAFVFAALAMAATEHLIHAEPPLPAMLAIASGALGLLGALVGGMGLLYAGRKQRWLHRRLMTERLRQFHFQTLVRRLPDIAESLESHTAKAAYLRKRDAWFADFLTRHRGKLEAEFTDVKDDEKAERMWLHDKPRPWVGGLASAGLEKVFDAYWLLRLQHQLGYANYKLSEDHKLISKLPRRQADVLYVSGLICFALICLIHVGVIAAAVSDQVFALHIFATHADSAGLSSGLISVAVVWLALLALAIRAIEQGLQPEREIERYQQYRSAVRAMCDRFEEASSHDAKLKVMAEMERLVFDEMRNFLITNDRSRFVM